MQRNWHSGIKMTSRRRLRIVAVLTMVLLLGCTQFGIMSLSSAPFVFNFDFAMDEQPFEGNDGGSTDRDSERANERDNEGYNELDTSACVVTKDDPSLLPEWIAYHYHVLQLRFLMVAVDPSSQINPDPIFNRFRLELPDLIIMRYYDKDFLPDWFDEGRPSEFHRIRGYSKRRNNTHEGRMHNIEKKHNFRQEEFIHHCTMTARERQRRAQEKLLAESPEDDLETRAKILAPQRNWVLFTDSDEFVVPNPKWRSFSNATEFLLPHMMMTQTATAGSVAQYIRNVHTYFPIVDDHHPYPRPSRVCMIMPMIRFTGISRMETVDAPMFPGAVDKTVPHAPSPFNLTRFETLEFNYHIDVRERVQRPEPLEVLQKVLVDVDIHGALPIDDDMMKPQSIASLHYPSKFCYSPPELNESPVDFHRDPLSLNHYTGSIDRFVFRSQDGRRNEEMFHKRNNVTKQRDDGWITTWLQHFVDIHGIEKVSRLLGDHFLKGHPTVFERVVRNGGSP